MSDDIVPYANTEAVQKVFGDKVTVKMDYWNRKHVACCTVWYLSLSFTNW